MTDGKAAASAQERYRPSFESTLGTTTLGSYGEVIYNNELSGGSDQIDLRRVVLFLAHDFNDWISFFAELEHEHAEGLEAEQAFLEFRAFEKATFRGGLLILPISHMNLYHEPVYFHSVERPDVDRYLVPSTWRELGASVSGELTDWLSYELQLNNSLSLTDSDGELKLADVETEGIREFRQEGRQALFNDIGLAGRVTVKPTLGLDVSASFFTGEADQSQAVEVDDAEAKLPDARITLLEADARFQRGGFDLRGEYAMVFVNEADELSALAGETVGERQQGFYLEAAYDMLRLITDTEQRLNLFYRYSWIDLASDVPTGFAANPESEWTIHSVGLAWLPIPQVVAKLDYEARDDDAGSRPDRLNVGLGYAF
ncbi:MAG: hypothetical protein IPK07_16195 [Deltaproteobacteria bacterium]|nr:hypothetical protein [Deltaproteobacteria bacterium]